MGRFTIWRNSFDTPRPGEAKGALSAAMIVGTYPGDTEEEALHAMARDTVKTPAQFDEQGVKIAAPVGFKDYDELAKARGYRRHHHTLAEIPDVSDKAKE